MLSHIISFAPTFLREINGINIVIYMLPVIILYTLHDAARRNLLFDHRLLFRDNFWTYKIGSNLWELTRGAQRHPRASILPNSDCMLSPSLLDHAVILLLALRGCEKKFNHRLLFFHNYWIYKIGCNLRDLARGAQRLPRASIHPNSDCMLSPSFLDRAVILLLVCVVAENT